VTAVTPGARPFFRHPAVLGAVVIGGDCRRILAATPVLFLTSPLVADCIAAVAVLTRPTPE